MSSQQSLNLKWSPASLRDIERLREYLQAYSTDAACRMATSLKQAAGMLLVHPGMGRAIEGRQDRELPVPFGKRGYIIRYRLEGHDVVILRIWHGLEDR